jgi:hypothetical protein
VLFLRPLNLVYPLSMLCFAGGQLDMRLFRSALIVALLSLITVSGLSAQTASLSGRVVDAQGGVVGPGH